MEVCRLGCRADKALGIAHSQCLGHVVGVNGLCTALMACARHRRSQGVRLVAWCLERRCHDHWGQLVRPDGYGRWHEHGTQVDFLLEYDRGTEPLDRLAAKLAEPARSPHPSCSGCPPRVGRPACARPSPATPDGPRRRSWWPPPARRLPSALVRPRGGGSTRPGRAAAWSSWTTRKADRRA
jgi:hypothetical protein